MSEAYQWAAHRIEYLIVYWLRKRQKHAQAWLEDVYFYPKFSNRLPAIVRSSATAQQRYVRRHARKVTP